MQLDKQSLNNQAVDHAYKQLPHLKN